MNKRDFDNLASSNKFCNTKHTKTDFTLEQRRRKRMGKKGEFDPKTQKIHQNVTSNKHLKSQVNGETEVTLQNQLLRSAAKANQF